jgi:hypothetical protein
MITNVFAVFFVVLCIIIITSAEESVIFKSNGQNHNFPGLLFSCHLTMILMVISAVVVDCNLALLPTMDHDEGLVSADGRQDGSPVAESLLLSRRSCLMGVKQQSAAAQKSAVTYVKIIDTQGNDDDIIMGTVGGHCCMNDVYEMLLFEM